MIDAPDALKDARLDIYFSDYARAVNEAGGAPIFIPLGTDARAIIEILDGVIIAGGEDVDPRRYGQIPVEEVTHVDPVRDETEMELIRAAQERGIPLLGTCRGHQMLNVTLGGTLVQHLDPKLGHVGTQYPPAHRVHDVTFDEGSVHHALYGDRTSVNTYHHQAVDRPGEGVRVVGHAPDGTPEAIEVVGQPMIGVQWHPEFFANDPIFDWLMTKARETRAERENA